MLRVLVGSNEEDFDLLAAAAVTGKPVGDWVVPKDAAVGDSVLFFTRSRGFVGEGTIASGAEPGEFGKKPGYRADVGSVRLFTSPVPIEHIVRELPGWRWATYPRHYVTPDPTDAKSLSAVIANFQSGRTVAANAVSSVDTATVGREVDCRQIVSDLASALNAAAHDFEVGNLQETRKRLHSLAHVPSHDLFTNKSVKDEYAFHIGGRTELQFNIGIEPGVGGDVIRHGVAFSLETSQALPDIEPLIPKIERFNDYVRTHPEDFPGFRMWHWEGKVRSSDLPVGPISDELVRGGIFVMLGRHVPMDAVEVGAILADFDRLLPLYVYVESSDGRTVPAQAREFKPGCPRFATTATVALPARTVDVALRHKQIEPVLYEILSAEAGERNVRIEHILDSGGQVDAAVQVDDGLTFYELKIAPTAQSCLRQATGQLLEYGFWASAPRARELIVVGEPALEADGQAYLRFLRERYGLPLWYRRIDFEGRVLGPKE